MKIDPNQAPQQNGPPEKTADSAPTQGTPTQGTNAQGTTAPDTPIKSPFFSLLSKGRKGEGELKGGEGGELMGEKGKSKGMFTTSFDKSGTPGKTISSETGPSPDMISPDMIPPDTKGKLRGGMQPGPGLGKSKVPGLKTEEQPGEGKTGAGLPHLHRPHPHPHNPLAGAGPRSTGPETTAKPAEFGRNIVKPADGRRQESPIGDQKTTPAVVAPTETPVLRGPEQPVVSHVHAAGSTADVERVQALAQEMVEKIQTTKGPGGDDRVDIQFNSRTLQGLQVSISRNEAGVSIRFNTASESVNQLLSQNVQSLMQGLAAKGIDVGDVKVIANSPMSETFNSGSGSRQESRQGGRGGDSGGSYGGGGGSSGGDGGNRGGQRGGR